MIDLKMLIESAWTIQQLQIAHEVFPQWFGAYILTWILSFVLFAVSWVSRDVVFRRIRAGTMAATPPVNTWLKIGFIVQVIAGFYFVLPIVCVVLPVLLDMI